MLQCYHNRQFLIQGKSSYFWAIKRQLFFFFGIVTL